jgi:hypothetical protein
VPSSASRPEFHLHGVVTTPPKNLARPAVTLAGLFHFGRHSALSMLSTHEVGVSLRSLRRLDTGAETSVYPSGRDRPALARCLRLGVASRDHACELMCIISNVNRLSHAARLVDDNSVKRHRALLDFGQRVRFRTKHFLEKPVRWLNNLMGISGGLDDNGQRIPRICDGVS